MIDIQSLEDIESIRESLDVECKLAAGRDGKGTIPEDFWPTYSAFANADGGIVFLGIREKQGRFIAEGIVEPARTRKELFDALNNPQKVSANLLNDSCVREIVLDGRKIFAIEVPRASRKVRPVYLTQNPFGHTFRRLSDGDRKLRDDEVKRMLADQVEDSRDDRILSHFDINDLDMSTFRAYRQVFANREPNHPWNAENDAEFLRLIGGWRTDRETGESGLTVAGLLLFGKMASIQEEFPNYMLDYQERPEPRTENRWIDRLTLDGKWSGNLYDFYRRAYLKLTADLKIPFRLEKGERKDETPVHEALREALANTLVHADYTDRAAVLVVKRPDMFGFRNPGLMRIPAEVAMRGGESDCRNRTLHRMFRLVGLGEQAGTGIPKILRDWRTQHWNPPKLHDTSEPYDQTILELRMVSFFPESVMSGLRNRFGATFEALSHPERVALALAANEGTVNHARLRAVISGHPVDVSKTLQHLRRQGLLESTGGRGAVYFLPGEIIPKPDDVFGEGAPAPSHSGGEPQGVSGSLPNLDESLPILGKSLPNLEKSPPHFYGSLPILAGCRDADGCLVVERIPLPIIDDLSTLSPVLRARLEKYAAEPRKRRKMEKQTLISVILSLCARNFVTVNCLAALVDRKPKTLRDQYLSPLVREKRLVLAFPTTPTHERQAYCASEAIRS